MKLKDWSPIKNASWVNKETQKHMKKEIKREFSQFSCKQRIEEQRGEPLRDDDEQGWFDFLDALHKTNFIQKYIYSFVELEDGTLIGFNENPAHGWSFPVGKWDKNNK